MNYSVKNNGFLKDERVHINQTSKFRNFRKEKGPFNNKSSISNLQQNQANPFQELEVAKEN